MKKIVFFTLVSAGFLSQLTYGAAAADNASSKPLRISCNWLGCDELLEDRNAFLEHRCKHTGQKLYTCELCQENFIREDLYVNHMKIHVPKKTFLKASHENLHKCDVSGCSYATAHKKALAKHKLAHTGEKPFKCSKCDYATALRKNLDRHRATHTGERPFKCPECDYAAIQKVNLDHHRATHTGESTAQPKRAKRTTSPSIINCQIEIILQFDIIIKNR